MGSPVFCDINPSTLNITNPAMKLVKQLTQLVAMASLKENIGPLYREVAVLLTTKYGPQLFSKEDAQERQTG